MYDEEYNEQKIIYERELEQLLDDKRKQRINLDNTMDCQNKLITLFDIMSVEDADLLSNGEFAECYDIIRNSSNDIIEACSNNYNLVCRQCEDIEEKIYELSVEQRMHDIGESNDEDNDDTRI